MTVLMQLQSVEEAGRLGPLSCEVRRGEILHLVGPNGAGKSTLLTRMAGLSGGKGRIALHDAPLEEWPAGRLARHRAYLTQQQQAPFAMPVWHYLTLHLYDKTAHALLSRVTQRLGLAGKLASAVNQLSGGEWQRVRLAAVMLQVHPQGNPYGELLLLDEPMNSLDVAQQAALDGLLGELREAGLTIVMSSHDLNHSLRHADRVWLLCAGKLIAAGAKETVLSVENLQAAYRMAFRRLESDGHQMLIPLPGGETSLASA